MNLGNRVKALEKEIVGDEDEGCVWCSRPITFVILPDGGKGITEIAPEEIEGGHCRRCGRQIKNENLTFKISNANQPSL